MSIFKGFSGLVKFIFPAFHFCTIPRRILRARSSPLYVLANDGLKVSVSLQPYDVHRSEARRCDGIKVGPAVQE